MRVVLKPFQTSIVFPVVTLEIVDVSVVVVVVIPALVKAWIEVVMPLANSSTQ